VKALLAKGHAVTAFDNLSAGHRQAVPAECLVVGDLRDVDHLDHVLVVNRIEAVVHFAAHCYVGESVTEPAKYYVNNVVHTLNLLERVRKHGIGRFVFSSSCATYGVPDRVPIDETTSQRPVNPYGNTKLVAEYALRDYAAAYGIGAVALRYFNAAGAAADGSLGEDHDPETHLIPIVLQVALGKRPHVAIFGTDYPTADGTCIRDYVHVDDLAEAHVLALGKMTPGRFAAFNVGTGLGHSVREVIHTAEAVTGKKVQTVESPRRAGDPAELVAAASAVRKELGWKPRYPDLETIVRHAWDWMRAHPNGYGK
jgi:UDP-glucose-4-epimerase GalE